MKKNYFLITIALAIFSYGIKAQAVSQTFNTSGTYTVPVGYNAIVSIEAWGAGAGGGSGTPERGGGGGGAYARTAGIALSAGTYTVTVGTGGGVGVNGGASSFTTLVIAAGGTSTTTITGGAGGTIAASTGTVRNAGGAGGAAGSGGGADGGGGGGSSAGIAVGATGANGSNGTANPTNTGGAGGVAPAGGGNGGRGADADGTPDANAGVAPGGGGGGRGDAGTSKAGAAGRIVVTVTASGPLPIKVYYLNAARDNNGNTLNWKAECTSSEATFEVERSADGRNFTSINTITASQLRCLQPFSFSDVDASFRSSLVYYRIKIIDQDGKISYSSIVKVGGLQKNIQLVGILPNPVSNTAQLNVTTTKKDNVQLAIVSLEGKVMYRNAVQLQSGSSIISLDVSGLAKGTYFVRGVFSDGQTNSVKFVKQ